MTLRLPEDGLHLDIMTRAVEEAWGVHQEESSSITAELSGYDGAYLDRLAVFEALTMRNIKAEKASALVLLADGTYRPVEEEINVRQADNLLMAAFDDGRTLLRFSSEFLYCNNVTSSQELNRILKNSTQLTRLAQLGNEGHGAFVDMYLRQPLAYEIPKLIRSDILESRGFALTDDKQGQPRVSWTPAVRQWMDENRGAGCPALRMVAEGDDGLKTTVLRRFWSQLVDVAHPVA